MVVAYGLTMTSIRLRWTGAVRAEDSTSRSSSSIAIAAVSEPAAAAEVSEHAREQGDNRADKDSEGVDRALAGDADVHAPNARDERQRQDDDADRGERLQDVVDAV